MSSVLNEIVNYCSRQNLSLDLKEDLLEKVVSSLSFSEFIVLVLLTDKTIYEEELADEYFFILRKIINRHDDLIEGTSSYNSDCILRTTRNSSITELDITLSCLNECNENGIYKISDATDDNLAKLSSDYNKMVVDALTHYLNVN